LRRKFPISQNCAGDVYVAPDVQPHSRLSVGFAGSIDEEIKFPDVDTSDDLDFFAVVNVWMAFQLANGHTNR
jgi:hypothetical protein